MNHKIHIEYYPDHKVLAEEIGNLRYDALQELFHELRMKFTRDGNDDLKRKRPKLAEELLTISARMRNSERSAEKAWEICKPFMKEND